MKRAIVVLICVLSLGLGFLPYGGVVTAQTPEECTDYDIRTIKYSRSTGGAFSETWNVTYDSGFQDRATEVTVDDDGNVYVTGNSNNGIDDDIRIIKYDNSGSVLWNVTYDLGGRELAYHISADANGYIYVTGTHKTSSVDILLLVKYSSEGTLQWAVQYDSGAHEMVSGAVPDELGNVYVAGVRYTWGWDSDRYLLKYDSDGTLIWDKRDFRSGRDVDGDIERDSLGYLYVTGFLDDQFRTTKYDGDGNVIWDTIQNPGVFDYADDIDIDAAGNVYVSGFSSDNYSYLDSVIQKYDNAGTLLWERRYPTSKPEGITVDTAGNVFVALHTSMVHPRTPFDIHTLQYDNVGNLVEDITYDSGAADESGGIVVDNAGNLYVTGHSVRCSNAPPTAEPGGPYLGAVGTPIALDGSGSSDPDGDMLTYHWDFGDAETSQDAAPDHTYATPDIYEACLTVTDTGGLADTKCTQVVVYDPSGGFVTGGGWIDSLAGAYKLGPLPFLVWDQGFEVDTAGWFDINSDWYGTISQVASGANGVGSSSGSYHALVEGDADSAPFSRFDGYRDTWTGTWTAEIDVYLDPGWATGTGFDYSVAATGSDGAHQRDYIFHVTKDTSTGKLLVAGSNNTNFAPREDLDTLANHYEVTSPDWYTLQHVFYEDSGALAVDLNLLDAAGTILFTETRHDTSDLIPAEVGGNRYAWYTFVNVDGGIAVDNHQLNLPLDPTGKANFGFVSKYNKKTAMAEGNTQFVFQAADLKFHSTSYDWLIINQNDSNAQYKGSGEINGQQAPTNNGQDYRFMVWAGDGDPDTFRIKIWYEDGGEVAVYDNGVNQPLGGGSIVIHKAKDVKAKGIDSNPNVLLPLLSR